MGLPEVGVRRLDHHGVVSGVIDDLGFVEVLDEAVGLDGREKLTVGQVVKGLIINGLGFSDSPLYLTPDFFEHLPLERLFGPGVTSEDFNRHRLSRVLDKLFECGLEKLFSLCASRAVLCEGVDTSRQVLDTTSFSVSGAYKGSEEGEEEEGRVRIVHGFSKDHRPDLKQVVTELIVSCEGGIPLHFCCHDGNASDSRVFQERVKALQERFQPSGTLIADSKLYAKEGIPALKKLRFITRIPENNHAVGQEITKALGQKASEWESLCLDEKRVFHYRGRELEHNGIRQRWVVVYSQEGLKRAEKSLQKKASQERESLEKKFKALRGETFSCPDDAQKAYKKLIKKVSYHELAEPQVTRVESYGKTRGRPRRGVIPAETFFQINPQIQKPLDLTQHIKEEACFVLGTNDLALSDLEVLKSYKEQGRVEEGFSFLKDPEFFTSSFFLKSPKRICALLMVMSLALLAYKIAQLRLRRALVAAGDTIPNQIKKPIQNPTMKWVFQIFRGINELSFEMQGEVKVVLQGLKELQLKIITYLGPHVQGLYQA